MAAVFCIRFFYLIAPQFTPHVVLSCPCWAPKFEYIIPPLHFFLSQTPPPSPGSVVPMWRV